MDEVLAGVAEDVKNFAVIYCVDITEVPDFNTMYELYDPCTVMFFIRNKPIMVDLGLCVRGCVRSCIQECEARECMVLGGRGHHVVGLGGRRRCSNTLLIQLVVDSGGCERRAWW